MLNVVLYRFASYLASAAVQWARSSQLADAGSSVCSGASV
jgi:hypothetical protein